MYRDSVDKIKAYLEAAGSKEVILSRLFFRDYTCPANCGACCPRFSLDYFEGERWELFKATYPDKVKFFKQREVDGVVIYTDAQDDHKDHYCRNLDKSTGRCTIHKSNPFSCEFELMKFIHRKSADKSLLINKLFGRGWAMKKINGERGTKCEMLGFDYDKLLRDLALLKELNDYANRFGITTTKLPQIIKFIDDNLENFKAGRLPKGNLKFKNKNEPTLFENGRDVHQQ